VTSRPVLALAVVACVAACARTDLDTLLDVRVEPYPDASAFDAATDAGDAGVDARPSDAGDAAIDAPHDAMTDADACVVAPNLDASPRDGGPVAPWVTRTDGFPAAMARDPFGDLYVTGSAGVNTSFYLAKLDPLGNTVWTKTLGTQFIFGIDLAFDRAGDLIVVGSTGNGAVIDFGGGPVLPGGFLVRYDRSGRFLSQTTFTTSSAFAAGIDAVGVLSSGDVVIAGGFRGTYDFGTGPLTAGGTSSAFVARYDRCGRTVFAKAFGGAGQSFVETMRIDANDDLFLAGIFDGVLDFGGGALAAPTTGWRTYVAKLDANGAHLASRQFSDDSTNTGLARASVDAAGNLVLGGTFDHTINLGGGTLTSAGGRDIYLAKLGPTLHHVWSKRFGDAGYQVAYATSIDPAGNILLTGAAAGTTDFGTGPLVTPTPNTERLFLARFDSSGAALASVIAGGVTDTATSHGGAVLPAFGRDVIVAGRYDGTFTLGPASYTTSYERWGFVLRLAL